MLYDSEHNVVITRIALEAIAFGSWVRITGENCELADSSAEVTADQGGIAIHTHNKPSGGVGYITGDPVAILRKGRAWVTPENTVTAGAAAYVRHTAGVGEVQGAFRSDADTSDAAVPPTAYYYLAIDGMAVVEVNQPGGAIGPTGVLGPTGPSGGPTGPTGPTGKTGATGP
jgi:hypothetical protein